MKQLSLTILFAVTSISSSAFAQAKVLADCGDVKLVASEPASGYIEGLPYSMPSFTVYYKQTAYVPFFRPDSEGGTWKVDLDEAGVLQIHSSSYGIGGVIPPHAMLMKNGVEVLSVSCHQ